MDVYRYKLSGEELKALVGIGDLTEPGVRDIRVAARERQPGEKAPRLVSFPLNKASTIRVQNVQYYGGEHFSQPYAFEAEILPFTSHSAWSRFVRTVREKTGLDLSKKTPFTY